eukprot:366268-Chlamydomonas_euryale.AAC.18
MRISRCLASAAAPTTGAEARQNAHRICTSVASTRRVRRQAASARSLNRQREHQLKLTTPSVVRTCRWLAARLWAAARRPTTAPGPAHRGAGA